MDPDESDIRDLWMVPALHKWCYEKDRSKSADYKRNLRAFLGRFVKGLEVDNQDYMKNWKKEIFELRVQLEPKGDNTRIFGGFVRPDVFVAVNWKSRSHFGDKTDPRWDRAINRAVAGINAALPGMPLMLAWPFSNCVTSNAIDAFL
jgi:hypothetical protein